VDGTSVTAAGYHLAERSSARWLDMLGAAQRTPDRGKPSPLPLLIAIHEH
jgi:hypothetical protein